MTNFARKVILNSKSGYSAEHMSILHQLIDDKVPLFCSVGRDCELWHDIMDELFVGDGDLDRGFDQITTWHTDETLGEVIEFAKIYHIDGIDNDEIQIIEV